MSQPTRFWRFSYDSEDSVTRMLDNESLVAPTIGIRSEKYDPEKCIATRVKVGDGVLLGKLDPDLGIGRIVAIGVVQNAKPATSIKWKRLNRDVHPNPRGGLAAWRERCFLFDSGPASKYNLIGDFLQHFPGC